MPPLLPVMRDTMTATRRQCAGVGRHSRPRREGSRRARAPEPLHRPLGAMVADERLDVGLAPVVRPACGVGTTPKSARRASSLIRIAITPAAFEAIAATLPLGSVGFEARPNSKGERLIWLVVDRLELARNVFHFRRSPIRSIQVLAAYRHERDASPGRIGPRGRRQVCWPRVRVNPETPSHPTPSRPGIAVCSGQRLPRYSLRQIGESNQ